MWDTVIPFLFSLCVNFLVDCCFLLSDLDMIILATFGSNFFRPRPGVLSRAIPFIWFSHHLRIVRMFAPISLETQLCVIPPLSIPIAIFLFWIGCSLTIIICDINQRILSVGNVDRNSNIKERVWIYELCALYY